MLIARKKDSCCVTHLLVISYFTECIPPGLSSYSSLLSFILLFTLTSSIFPLYHNHCCGDASFQFANSCFYWGRKTVSSLWQPSFGIEGLLEARES